MIWGEKTYHLENRLVGPCLEVPCLAVPYLEVPYLEVPYPVVPYPVVPCLEETVAHPSCQEEGIRQVQEERALVLFGRKV